MIVLNDPDYVPSITREKEIKASSLYNSIAGNFNCEIGEMLESGNCTPNDYSTTTESKKSTEAGEGWYCKFTPFNWDYLAGGTITITCVPE